MLPTNYLPSPPQLSDLPRFLLLSQAGIAAGQGGDILSQRAGAAQGLTGVAVPEPPLDPLQPILQGGCLMGLW